MKRLFLPNVPFESIIVKDEANEIRSTSTSGRTKVRKQFSYSRKEITATTPILTISEAKELNALMNEKETTISWIFTDINPDNKLEIFPTSIGANYIDFAPNSYRKDRFFVNQELEIIKDTGNVELAIISDIDLINSRITFTQNFLSTNIASIKGDTNYKVTFTEIPDIIKSGVLAGNYEAVTLKMKEL